MEKKLSSRNAAVGWGGVCGGRDVYPPNTLEQVPLPFPFSLPSPPLLSPSPPLPSPPLPPLPSLPLPLEVGPPYCVRLGVWGSALAPTAGPGGARPPNGIW